MFTPIRQALALAAAMAAMAQPAVAAIRIHEPVVHPGASTDPLGLPRSGQDVRLPLVPPAPFSDQTLQSGRAWPQPRFIDNGDGTVTDRLSGLVWLRRADCLGKLPWHKARAAAARLADTGTRSTSDDCGLMDSSRPGDWRLPTVDELHGLIAWQYASPALSNAQGDGQCLPGDCAFSGVGKGMYYWSATDYLKDPSLAWGLSLGGGGEGRTSKKVGCAVWPVRREIPDDRKERQVHLNHTVTVRGTSRSLRVGGTSIPLVSGGKRVPMDRLNRDFAVVAFFDSRHRVVNSETAPVRLLERIIRNSPHPAFLLVAPARSGTMDQGLVAVQYGNEKGVVRHLGSFASVDRIRLNFDSAGHTATPPPEDPLRPEWPAPRFTDNGDGTVTDNLTGLIWLRRADCFARDMSWKEALITAATKLFDSGSPDPTDDCGLADGSSPGDWRVPNVRELHGITSRYFHAPALPDATGAHACRGKNCVFKGVDKDVSLWTSTLFAKKPQEAWAVRMEDGGLFHTSRQGGNRIWPVRSPLGRGR